MKVLEVCAGLNIGGAQAVAANIAKYADDSMQFYYLVYGDTVGEYEAEIEARGNVVLHWPAPSRNLVQYFFKLVRLMRDERFDVVHCHTMFSCCIVMLAGQIANVPARISHSHTTKEECIENFTRKIYKRLMRSLIQLCANEYLACGVEAGYALYGQEWFTKRGFVIPNGVDIAQYRFSKENRDTIRQLHHLNNRLVIGHVGHLLGVKNQTFLIDLMLHLHTICPEAILLLFGEGEDRAMLTDKIQKNHAADYIRLMGNVGNIGEVLSAFDVFVFPSLFEGTPLALIEAQANGLPCIISDAIPMDACLTSDITRMSLSESMDQWVDQILRAKRSSDEDKTTVLLDKYEDVRDSMNRLYEIFKKYRRVT